VRLATNQDIDSLLKMTSYRNLKCDLLLHKEDVLVAEIDGMIRGAVSVSGKTVSVVYGEWKEGFEPRQENLLQLVSKGWISKLYVFPEYRNQGIGKKLVEEALNLLEKKNFTEAYAGIYVKNESRDISHHIFEKAGFEKIGSCVCLLANGYCRGTLLKRAITSSEARAQG
jgi:ribosomal protein S18 acetylase RimI-like enzyme